MLANFRPIISNQLPSYLSHNPIHEKCQSGFKSCHSTESALLRVINDVMLITDSGQFTALVLLDVSSAFDLVNHDILISRLEACVGLRGTVLQWFRSYHSSSETHLRSGVPQGSIIGPVLFSLYMLPLGFIFNKH